MTVVVTTAARVDMASETQYTRRQKLKVLFISLYLPHPLLSSLRIPGTLPPSDIVGARECPMVTIL